ncbi:MAG: prolyl oligopeptidase family serine peptidase [Planctomycetota bacterium]
MSCKSHTFSPPTTEQRPVADTMHGVEIVDPYRWLEGDANAELTEEVDDWTTAQNHYTRTILDGLPGRDKLEARLTELMQVGYVGAPTMRGNLYFNAEREGDQDHAVLYVREGYDGNKRVLLDVNTLSEDKLTALGWWSPSPDGSLLSFGLYEAGDENTTLHLMDVATGEWLDTKITGKAGGIQWLPDNKRFFYSKLADIGNPYSKQIKLHTIGEDPANDRLMFEQYKEGPLATTWGPFFSMQREGNWGLIGYWTSTSANDLYLVDVKKWLPTDELVMTPLIEGADANTFGQFIGGRLLLTTHVDAPNGMVYEVNIDTPKRDQWEVLIPHLDMVLGGIQETKDHLVIEYTDKAKSSFMLMNKEKKWLSPLDIPGIGSAGFSTRYDRQEAFLTFTSFNEPRSVYRTVFDTFENNDYVIWSRPDVPVNPSLLDVKQVTYNSKDGTPVTMFLVHKKGIELDGSNPTILSGYGGFGISMTPRFSATMFPWYEAGGVMAIPNLRGGGEYGDDWHKAGKLENKQNVYDDFIAAAEWLIDQGYTSNDKLAIRGGSNGGLLVGAVMVQRPDLCKAVLCGVPLLDMLRYDRFLMAKYWVPEYGDPASEEHFNWLRAYSPYHNVTPGTDYPATLITAGENDTRVHPLHARKMAALLQGATASDPADKPVMLWVDRDGGHGGGKPLSQRVRDIADQRIFLMWQLGILEDQ